jgi:2-dehydropantoate 2-reductase
VYGAGAVGGVIGARLHLAGAQTTVVARGEHLARIRERGLVLDTATGREPVAVEATDTAADVDWAHSPVVLLTVKSHQTGAALDDLATHAPADTVVVSAQNGVANEAAILRRFASAYSICVMLPSAHVEPGVVIQQCWPTPGILDIGRFPGGADEMTTTSAADLVRAGFVSEPRPDIMAWKYRKLVLNLGNAVQAACRPGKEADELARRAREEGEAIISAAGIPMVSETADRERRGNILRGRPRAESTRGGSTWQSISRGTGNVETDYLAGEIVLIGRLHGIPTPVNELLQHATNELARRRGRVTSLDAASLLAALVSGGQHGLTGGVAGP